MANIVIPTQTITKTITGSGNSQSVGSKKIVLNTKDTYVPENIEVNVSATVNVAAASLANIATSGQTYTENTDNATIIPSGGALYINKGWIDNTKITLGHMIPDDDDYDNAGVEWIYHDLESYDTDGNKLIGTMPDTRLTSSGGTMSGTLILGDSTINVTPSITGTGVSTTQGQKYGVTATQPSGIDGTNYLTFDPDATGGTHTATASIKVTRSKVTTTGIPGYYNGSDVILAADEQSFTETADISTSIQAGSNWYMPIVSPAGSGGSVSKVTNGSTLTITGKNPTVTLSQTGKFTEVGASGVATTYGVIEGVPSGGEDGTNYLSIVTDGSSDTQTFNGNATIKYTRAKVTSAANYKGAVNISSGATLLVQSSPSSGLTHSGSTTITATVSGAKTYSIPIVTMSHSGGDISGFASGTQGERAKTTTTNKFTGKTSTGTEVSAADYGFVQNSETTATNGHITIYTTTTSDTTPTCVVTATASTTAVTYTNAAGAIAAHDATQALAAKTDVSLTGTTVTLSAVNVTYGKRSFTVPIVEPKGTVGVVSVDATASISPVGEGGSTAPEVSIDYSGYINDHDSDYGIVYTQPTGFVDGENYSLLKVSNTNTDGSIVGSVSGSYDRTAVNADASYKGVVNMSTSTQLLAAANDQPISGIFTTGSIGATVTGQKNIYIPISVHEITGGDMTLSSFSVSGPTAKTMTPSTSFQKGTGTSGTPSAATLSDYGITTSKSSGSWVLFDPVVSDGSKTSGTQSISLSGTAKINRAAVTATATPGITKQAQWSKAAVSAQQFTGTGTWSYTLATGDNYYIPVVSPTATVTHTKTDAQVSTSENASFKIQGNSQQLPTGVKILSSAPSDLNTHAGGYIIIEPSVSTTAGSTTATGKASINKGITTGATDIESTASTLSVGITDNGTTNKCYIKVYKADSNGYTIT